MIDRGCPLKQFEPTRLTDYSESALAAELRRVATLIGAGRFTVTEFERHARVARQTLIRRFGGWREALVAAGLPHLYNEPCLSVKSHKQLAKHFSDDELLEEVRAVARKLETTRLTKRLFNEHARINGESVRRLFGNWDDVLRAAGLEQVPVGRRYSDDQCHENLLDVWTFYGRPPKYKEMSRLPSKVGGKAYVLRWGTWTKAIHAFAAKVESDLRAPETTSGESEVIQESTGLVRNAQPLPAPERRDIRIGLRYAVLRRDRFRCVLCGRTPATDVDCVLHVDHIEPFSRGGKTVLENLRSTCSTCNLGRGNRE